MKRIAAGQFQARCLHILAEVHATRVPVLITKRGRPIAKIVAVAAPSKFLGRLQGVIKIRGDIESPIVPADAWSINR